MKERKDAIGLFWDETAAERKLFAEAQISTQAIPETGWRPPTDWPMIRDSPWISLDCETFDPELNEAGPGWARGKGHVVGISLACPAGKWYFPIRHTIQTHYNMDVKNVLSYLAWVLSGDCPKIGANLTYDVGWLKQEGVKVCGPLYDVLFAEAILNERFKEGLDALGWKYLRKGKESAVLKAWCQASYKAPETKWRKNIFRCPPSLVGPYAEDDAEMPYYILVKQWPELLRRGLLELFQMECGLINLFVEMRFAGVTVDVKRAEELKVQFDGEAVELTKQAEYISGGKNLNVKAAASLAEHFDLMGLEYPRTAATTNYPNGQPSFTKDFLKGLTHPFGKIVGQIKFLETLSSTFLQGYIIDNNVNGIMYCSFNQLPSEAGGARTGRLSSSDPNFQNLPTRANYGLDYGKLVRSAFIPDVGHVNFIDYDYSQIEYRMLAHFATGEGSDALRQSFIDDPEMDYHKFVGAMILEITGIELARSHIKTVNFGSVYGVGTNHLCEMLSLEFEKGKELLNHYHKTLPYVKDTMESVASETNRTGIVQTILNRQSHFDEWEPVEWSRKSTPLPYDAAVREWGNDIQRAWLYKAVNYKLQGSAADMMKKGMYECYRQGIFTETGVPRLTVHDELLFSNPGGIKESTWKAMQNVFETCIPCRIPIIFDRSEGANWMEAH